MTVVRQYNIRENAYPISVFALYLLTTVTEKPEMCLVSLPSFLWQ